MKVLEANCDTEIEVYIESKTAYLTAKRIFDFSASLIASIILVIPMVIVAILIFIKDPGNPFYVQKRVGQNGKIIKVVKFRSMRKNADNLEEMLTPEELIRYKTEYKLEKDPRLLGYKKGNKTSFGEIIRKTSIDELPQIPFNILFMGNMSFVGPRPILKEELEENYTKEEQKIFLSAKPGLTGYWQANARNNATYATGLRQKMELYYVRHANFWMDIKIILDTFGAVISMDGAN